MKKITALFLTVLLTFMCIAPAVSAASISPDTYYQTGASVVLDGIQKNEYQNDNGTKIIEYTNIGDYVDSMLARRSSTLSPYDLAKSIALEIEGDAAEHLPEEYIMEALTYKEAIKMESYIKVSSDGTQTYLNADEMMDELILKIQNEQLSLTGDEFGDIEYSDDGYMLLETLAIRVESPIDCVDERNHYYILSVTSNWLDRPTWHYEDVLAINYGTAIFDDKYKNYASIFESELCGFCDHYEVLSGYVESSKYGDTHSSSEIEDHINYEYPDGPGVAARVNFVKKVKMCLHGDANGSYDLSYINKMESYLRTRVYSQDYDFVIRAAYSHKWVGLSSITPVFSVGTGGADAGIDFEFGFGHTDYKGDKVTVTYVSSYE